MQVVKCENILRSLVIKLSDIGWVYIIKSSQNKFSKEMLLGAPFRISRSSALPNVGQAFINAERTRPDT